MQDSTCYVGGITPCKVQNTPQEFLAKDFPMAHKVKRPFNYVHSTETSISATFERIKALPKKKSRAK